MGGGKRGKRHLAVLSGYNISRVLSPPSFMHPTFHISSHPSLPPSLPPSPPSFLPPFFHAAPLPSEKEMAVANDSVMPTTTTTTTTRRVCLGKEEGWKGASVGEVMVIQRRTNRTRTRRSAKDNRRARMCVCVERETQEQEEGEESRGG